MAASATSATAQELAGWNDTNNGWQTFDNWSKPVAAEKPQQAKNTKSRTAKKSTSSEPTTRAFSSNRALVRSIAIRFADDPILTDNGISSREWLIFFEAMIEIESGFDDGALSHAGAIGLAQLMPGTADTLGVDPHDKTQNVEGGARYLLEQIDTFGTLTEAVAAYNAGPGALQKHGGIPPYRETERHVAKVLSIYERRLRKQNLKRSET